MTVWAPEHIAKLRELTAAGLSAQKIAQAMTVAFGIERSRNSIIAKLDRGNGGYGQLANRQAAVPGAGAKKGSVRAKQSPVIRKPLPPLVVVEPVANLPAPLPIGFWRAVETGRCLHYAGDPFSQGGPDMPVCGAERARFATHDNRYCRRHMMLRSAAA